MTTIHRTIVKITNALLFTIHSKTQHSMFTFVLHRLATRTWHGARSILNLPRSRFFFSYLSGYARVFWATSRGFRPLCFFYSEVKVMFLFGNTSQSLGKVLLRLLQMVFRIILVFFFNVTFIVNFDTTIFISHKKKTNEDHLFVSCNRFTCSPNSCNVFDANRSLYYICSSNIDFVPVDGSKLGPFHTQRVLAKPRSRILRWIQRRNRKRPPAVLGASRLTQRLSPVSVLSNQKYKYIQSVLLFVGFEKYNL